MAWGTSDISLLPIKNSSTPVIIPFVASVAIIGGILRLVTMTPFTIPHINPKTAANM
jgi:hypothetical protein